MNTPHDGLAKPKTKNMMGLVMGIAALGGLLFGDDTGIIGVALLGLGRQFSMDDTTKQLVTCAIIFGALFGGLDTGPLSDRLGRRRMVIAVGALFAIGSIASALSPGIGFLIASRFLLGLSAGSSTQIIPVYIAEVSGVYLLPGAGDDGQEPGENRARIARSPVLSVSKESGQGSLMLRIERQALPLRGVSRRSI